MEEYIRRFVDSVKNQTYNDFELILPDDGSTDNCHAICNEYARCDPWVRVIHKPNGGLISACSAGIMATKDDCYVDGEDWTKENMREFIHEKLIQSPVSLNIVALRRGQRV